MGGGRSESGLPATLGNPPLPATLEAIKPALVTAGMNSAYPRRTGRYAPIALRLVMGRSL